MLVSLYYYLFIGYLICKEKFSDYMMGNEMVNKIREKKQKDLENNEKLEEASLDMCK